MMMTYDLPTVSAQPGGGPEVAAPEVRDVAGAQMKEAGDVSAKAGSAINYVAQTLQNDIDTAVTKEMDNKLADAVRTTLYDPEKGYLSTSGKSALVAREGSITAIKNSVTDLEKNLGNDVQKAMFHKVAAQRIQSAMMLIDGHAMQQAKAYNVTEAKARLDGARMDAVANWAGWEDKASLYTRSRTIMRSEVDSVAEQAGIPRDSAQYKQLVQAADTQLHADILNNMLSLGQSTQAKKYFDAHVQEIAPDKLDEIRSHLKVATTATEADDMATKVWKEMAPTDRNGAIPIFQMAERVRELAGENEDVQKAALQGIKERAAEWNAEQTEYKSQNIAGVWRQLDSGTSWKQVQLSESWRLLSDTERHQVKKEWESEEATREARAAAAASRAASNAQRGLIQMERNERLAFMKNGDLYLTVSDPKVLRSMSRAQIESMRGKFGMERTLHLLRAWDSIQDPSKYKDAVIDTDAFKQAARSLGLNPDTKNQTEKARVGALKYHLEQEISYEQQRRKAPMTAVEKQQFINQSLSRNVLINGFWTNSNKPVMSLTAEDLNKVIIPRDEQLKISAAMEQKYRETRDPRYAPGRKNLVIWYLKKKAPGFSDFSAGVE